MAFYKFTIDDDLNMEQVDHNDNSQEHSLFRTRCAIHQKIFDVVIDDDSPENFVSQDVVQHLKMPIETIPETYTIRWENSSSKIMVSEVYKIPFSIGEYKDELMFNIVEMDACHIILGKPWVHDLKATYNDTKNTYMFRFNGVKKIIVPLLDNNDTKVSKPTQDDSKVTGQQDLKKESKDKIVTDAIVATTVLHDDISNKIPKKLKLLDEVSQARIPDELQPIISPMLDIPLPNTEVIPGVRNSMLSSTVKRMICSSFNKMFYSF
uniref:Uncharacterized protein n=1 Tax=Tanacetum cinerariifolium TaxID=118510 RepID=A0A6L2LSE7_TANCI|nr:hypothetical protein [Tanacetum cinerariifolium]